MDDKPSTLERIITNTIMILMVVAQVGYLALIMWPESPTNDKPAYVSHEDRVEQKLDKIIELIKEPK